MIKDSVNSVPFLGFGLRHTKTFRRFGRKNPKKRKPREKGPDLLYDFDKLSSTVMMYCLIADMIVNESWDHRAIINCQEFDRV